MPAQRRAASPPALGTGTTRTSRLLFKRHLEHLQLRLYPLLSVASGLPHPAFPTSILHYHVLTEDQLDELAHFYHQRTPSALSLDYPAPVISRWSRAAGIEDKRRRFGRFIGLRGCESPLELATNTNKLGGGEDIGAKKEDEGEGVDNGEDDPGNMATQEEMNRWCEMRIRRGIERDTEREMWRRKGF